MKIFENMTIPSYISWLTLEKKSMNWGKIDNKRYFYSTSKYKVRPSSIWLAFLTTSIYLFDDVTYVTVGGKIQGHGYVVGCAIGLILMNERQFQFEV